MTNIGVIGTGLMGNPMAIRLCNMTKQLTVYNRTMSKTSELKAKGAHVATSPTAVFERSDIVVLMLSDAEAIAHILFEPTVALSQRTVLQMGTIAPQESQQIHDRITSAGGEYFEAPVLGSIPEAKSGNLIVMVGGTTQQFDQWQPLLTQLGPSPTLVGPVGTAAAVKLALNQLIGSLTTAFSLSLGLTQSAGVDPEVFMSILRESALYAPTFDKKLTRMLTQNYANPNFPTKHLLKDMRLFSQTAAALDMPTGPSQSIVQIIEQAINAGLADSDYSAIFSQIQASASSSEQ